MKDNADKSIFNEIGPGGLKQWEAALLAFSTDVAAFLAKPCDLGNRRCSNV